jgi:copper(I)-binding protein
MKRYGTFFSLLLALTFVFGGFGASAQMGHGQGDGTPAAGMGGMDPAGTPMAGGMHGDAMGLSMGAAYLTITNNGDDADRLVSAETGMAGVVEIHEVKMSGGVMQMSPLADGLEIPAGETVTLEPGGYHMMLIGLTESLLAGEEYTLVLTFEKAGEVELTVPILRTAPDDNEGTAGAVEAGDLVIEYAWSRQAPKLDGTGTPMASPEATPAS